MYGAVGLRVFEGTVVRSTDDLLIISSILTLQLVLKLIVKGMVFPEPYTLCREPNESPSKDSTVAHTHTIKAFHASATDTQWRYAARTAATTNAHKNATCIPWLYPLRWQHLCIVPRQLSCTLLSWYAVVSLPLAVSLRGRQGLSTAGLL